MLKNKYKIEVLPITDEFLRQKRVLQDRGELVLVSDGEDIRHITFFTLNPGPNFFRGGHYHKNKTEKYYIVSGKARLFLADVESYEAVTLELEVGENATIYPMCAHKFEAITSIQVIEYYSSPFDLQDEYRYKYFFGD